MAGIGLAGFGMLMLVGRGFHEASWSILSGLELPPITLRSFRLLNGGVIGLMAVGVVATTLRLALDNHRFEGASRQRLLRHALWLVSGLLLISAVFGLWSGAARAIFAL